MIKNTLPLLAAATCALVANLPAQGEGDYTATLKYRPAPKWDLILPGERWRPVSTLEIPAAGEHGFRAEKDGLALAIDSNADGSLDKKVKGTSGFVVLSGKRPDGSALQYAMRVRLAASAERATSDATYLSASER